MLLRLSRGSPRARIGTSALREGERADLTAPSTGRRCMASSRASTPTGCAGSDESMNGCGLSPRPRRPGAGSSSRAPRCSPTGPGAALPGDQDDKSRMAERLTPGSVGPGGVKFPTTRRHRGGALTFPADRYRTADGGSGQRRSSFGSRESTGRNIFLGMLRSESMSERADTHWRAGKPRARTHPCCAVTSVAAAGWARRSWSGRTPTPTRHWPTSTVSKRRRAPSISRWRRIRFSADLRARAGAPGR